MSVESNIDCSRMIATLLKHSTICSFLEVGDLLRLRCVSTDVYAVVMEQLRLRQKQAIIKTSTSLESLKSLAKVFCGASMVIVVPGKQQAVTLSNCRLLQQTFLLFPHICQLVVSPKGCSDYYELSAFQLWSRPAFSNIDIDKVVLLEKLVLRRVLIDTKDLCSLVSAMTRLQSLAVEYCKGAGREWLTLLPKSLKEISIKEMSSVCNDDRISFRLPHVVNATIKHQCLSESCPSNVDAVSLAFGNPSLVTLCLYAKGALVRTNLDTLKNLRLHLTMTRDVLIGVSSSSVKRLEIKTKFQDFSLVCLRLSRSCPNVESLIVNKSGGFTTEPGTFEPFTKLKCLTLRCKKYICGTANGVVADVATLERLKCVYLQFQQFNQIKEDGFASNMQMLICTFPHYVSVHAAVQTKVGGSHLFGPWPQNVSCRVRPLPKVSELFLTPDMM